MFFKKLIISFIFVFSPFCILTASYMDSVIKIYAVTSRPDFQNPWQNLPDESQTGSACLISGNRILTCAHIVKNSTFIMVRKQGDPQKYIAKLEVIGEDSDLAILKVDDPNFNKNMAPLEIGTTPALQDSVTVYGYPIGGDNISITKGVVSRIEPTVYAYSSKWLLGAQIDAAINPGNSGGPVIKDGKLVGLAFQGLEHSSNIGYMIPTQVIRHFLDDTKRDHKEDGVPLLGIQFETMESSDLRNWSQMNKDQSGVLITHVLPEVKELSKLRKNDVLLAINGIKIANDGTVPFRKYLNILFTYLIWQKHIGDTVDLTILRNGKIIEVKQILTKVSNLVSHAKSQPSYYIFGGFVFTPLTVDYINSMPKPSLELLSLLKKGEITKKQKQAVILSKVLADDFNIGYQDFSNCIISAVNGVHVRDLKHLVSLISQTKGKFITITLDNHLKIVLDYKKGLGSTPAILKRYRIISNRSKDL